MPSSDTRRFFPDQSGPVDLREHDAWSRRMWQRMDRDGNGYITRAELDCEEFRSVIRGVLAPTTGRAMGGLDYARAEMNMDQAIHYCARKADLNCDRCLSFEEFKSFLFVLRHQDLGKNTAHLIFALFDLDGDGWIDESEFREVFRFYLGHNPREDQFQEEWGKLDCRGEQRVDVHRYIEWLKTSTNPIFHQHAPSPARKAMEDASEVPDSPSPSPSPSASLCMSSSSKFLPRFHSTSSSLPRPKWNQKFTTGANKNDNCPQGQRNYFTKAQSLPELRRHYKTHRGCKDLLQALSKPQMKQKPPVLSSEKSGEIALPRSAPGTRHGFMKSRETGKVEHWEEFWQAPKCVREYYQPGTLSFRCPGTPPKWMTTDLYDDE